MKFVFLLTVVTSLSVALVGCKPAANSAAKAPPPPVKVITENDLASIVLTPEAEQRLGITTAPIEVKPMSLSRAFSGDLLLPLGNAGTATNAAAAANSIYSLLPAMTPAELVRVGEMQVDADGTVAAAKVELAAANVASGRAQMLVTNSAGTQRGADEARARVQLAEAALLTAQQRRELLGVPLFDAIQKDVLWVRASIYAGDLTKVKRDAPVRVSRLGASGKDAFFQARPVSVPFSPSVMPATVDLFYEFDNREGKLRPGERVNVNVPLQSEAESSVVSDSAVLYDIHGGTWVYENTAPQTYTRRRVEIRWIDGASAVLVRGPKPGAKIVTAGCAELFGVEFGFGK